MKKLLVAILLTTSFSTAAHPCFVMAWMKWSETTDEFGYTVCKWRLEYQPWIDPIYTTTRGKDYCPNPTR